MLKASALYMVIIMALVISVLCSAVIVAGYYYKSVYQQSFRYDQQKNNSQSGINILLTNGDAYTTEKKISLFGNDSDSLILKQNTWGIFDVGIVRSFIQHDTLSRAFMIANAIDSTKWGALYLIDEDRSVSVSGNTHIRGNAFLPKAGIREAYVNNQAYTGDKRIVIGVKKTSEKKLPPLTEQRINNIEKLLNAPRANNSNLVKNDSVNVSFLTTSKTYDFKKNAITLSNIKLSGNIILYSDTTLTIDSTARLNQVIVFARSIVVKSGFKGNCQLFASDTIYADRHCVFEYPSCLGIVNFNSNKALKKISINDYSEINGTVFIYERTKGIVLPIINLGQQVTVRGQVFAEGLVNLKDKIHIYGSVFTNRFTYQTAYTRYENYLINLDIDVLKLSPYYLSSDLAPVAGKKRKVLIWLR
ncbi:MAG: hypothetical protein V4592_04820 [Bacteroidota bacterium]